MRRLGWECRNAGELSMRVRVVRLEGGPCAGWMMSVGTAREHLGHAWEGR